jgi:hypothetical protein
MIKLWAVVRPVGQRTPTVPPPILTRAVDPSTGQVTATVRISAAKAGAGVVATGSGAAATVGIAAGAAISAGGGGAGGGGGRVATLVTFAVGVRPQTTDLRSLDILGTQLAVPPTLPRA